MSSNESDKTTMYKSILITGANGDIADGIARILKEKYPAAKLFGADMTGQWPGLALMNDVFIIPKATDPTYIQALRDLTEQVDADLVIPTNEFELRRLSEDWDQVADLPLLMNSPKTTLLFLDKLNTYQFLTSSGIVAPFTTELPLAQASQLPMIVKPRSGSGSKAITVVRDGDALVALQQTLGGTAVAQSFLEGEDNEFTCAIVRIENDVRTLVMRRQLLGGLTTKIKVEYIPEIEAMLHSVSDAIGSYLTLNIQLRMTEHGPRIFEINPRFSSTVMMRHCIGFQDLAWVCDMRAGVKVPPLNPIPEGTQVFRRYREVIQPA